MLQEGIYNITNVSTGRVLAIGPDAASWSELQLWEARRRTAWWRYTTDIPSESLRRSGSSTITSKGVSDVQYEIHLQGLGISIRNSSGEKYVVAQWGASRKGGYDLKPVAAYDTSQYWTFTYQRSLQANYDRGQYSDGQGRGGRSTSTGDVVVKPEPKPQVDAATQVLADANRQLLKQIAASNAMQQQIWMTILAQTLGNGGGGGAHTSGGRGLPNASISPASSRASSPDPKEDRDESEDEGSDAPTATKPMPKPKKKAGKGVKKPAGGKKPAAGKKPTVGNKVGGTGSRNKTGKANSKGKGKAAAQPP
ncbi:hypothetical protein GLOTRDRAFT_122906 [Gloeophyllum trabeum ATCC 11539]|uniref:Uncharacterized protein n=1 Tax=Gloeophyllum trabeum (strain ATCC 11539 / FP-39264 / Madison 617) TaxID=670483 RepID=S7RDL2_GLOTA|nr:uncharacterized protein GLOTRDRAFT_122906 [Gloeophyllum trabeum ATCC 11539]EPQ52310.1 hypothetical protein GLOTRDRAFT_122906 [Gloeophyllum trabeum ATCC 11539]